MGLSLNARGKQRQGLSDVNITPQVSDPPPRIATMANNRHITKDSGYTEEDSAIRLISTLFEAFYKTGTPSVVAERILYQTANKTTINCCFAFSGESWTALMNNELRIITRREVSMVFDMDKQQELDRIMYAWRHDTTAREIESVRLDILDILESDPTTPV